MIKKSKIFVVLILFASFLLFSAKVELKTAQKIASNWSYILNTQYGENVEVELERIRPIYYKGILVGYVVPLKPKGFIMVSGEDYLPPIKLYSLNNNFGEEGKLFERTISEIQYRIIKEIKENEISPKEYFLPKNFKDFVFLKEGVKKVPLYSEVDSNKSPKVFDVSPLLTTRWNQGDPYNRKCPVINGRRSVTGCVATAFAQILKYFGYPDIGRGSYSYTTDTYGLNLSTSFTHKYYWDKMLDTYTGNESQEAIDAVSRLMYDVGVAFEMDYSPDGSGAYASFAIAHLPKFFKYSTDIKGIGRWQVGSDSRWFEIAKEQIDWTLPVAFSIYTEDSGHEVVIDGYRISNGSTTFHINMGWGGAYDAYYSLNNVLNFTKNEWQYYVYNIYPPNYFAVLPPKNVKASAYSNESIFFSQFVVEVSWDESPSGKDEVKKYVVYLKDKYGNVTKVGETSNDTFTYQFRVANIELGAKISVTAVNYDDVESIKSFVDVTVRN